ncbi:hypothetical protein ACTJJB_01700 [Chitinophaga sp. 22536]|uniref:hypothetical protein n=1 Tax=unclassified Chitinophaga TaxID=2619133 RepID=UPI003F8328DD
MQNNLTDFLHTFPAQVVTIVIVTVVWAILMPKENIDGEDRYKDRTSYRKIGRGVHNEAIKGQ